MPEFTLAPCPFCGGRNKAISPRYAPAAKTSKPVLAGYEIACGCGCHLCRAWLGRTTKVAVRRVLAVAWNHRAEAERINSAGFRACPLCASVGVGVATDRAWLAGGHTRIAVTCGACGLAFVPAIAPGEHVSLAEMRCAWNSRHGAPISASGPTSPVIAPAQPPEVERALSYGFRELMWHLEQHWEALGGPTLRGEG